METKMPNLISKLILSAVAVTALSMGVMNVSQARDIRDHRNACNVLDPANCRDHRGPDVVIPPPPAPAGPIVVVDPVPFPRPPIEPPHRPHHPQHPNPWADNGDDEDSYDGITCGEGRRIVKHSGFKNVKALDCSGEIYKYKAFNRKHGPATVFVNMDGDIVRVNYWVAYR
jgi:hypothetical protein